MSQTEMRFSGSSANDLERMVKEPVARQSSPKHRGKSFAQKMGFRMTDSETDRVI